MIKQGEPLLKYQAEYWLGYVRTSLDAALECVPDDRLNWAPAPQMMTLGNVFLHIAETSDWWYDDVMKGRKAVDLVTSIDSPSPPKEVIARQMQNHWARMTRFFEDDPAIMGLRYTVKGRERTYQRDGWWIFTHLLEHDIHHRSQINQYLRILGITPPEI